MKVLSSATNLIANVLNGIDSVSANGIKVAENLSRMAERASSAMLMEQEFELAKDYDALLASDPELAEQLGLKPRI